MRDIVNALLTREATVLLARRSLRRKSYAGLWSFPGGHVEQNESLEQALVRELGEEVGIVPVAFRLLRSIDDPNSATDDPIVYHMYLVTDWRGGEPAIHDGEHSELRWFTRAAAIALPDLALDDYRPLLLEIAELAPGQA
jgi:mutator protein MutT